MIRGMIAGLEVDSGDLQDQVIMFQVVLGVYRVWGTWLVEQSKGHRISGACLGVYGYEYKIMSTYSVRGTRQGQEQRFDDAALGVQG